jgi:hypothetical protein
MNLILLLLLQQDHPKNPRHPHHCNPGHCDPTVPTVPEWFMILFFITAIAIAIYYINKRVEA